MPDFAFTEEQDALRATVRRFCDERSPSAEVRRLMDTTEGFDPDVWKQLAEDLGLTGIHIPEEYGGSGFTFVELGIVLEELGRSLFCSPFFSSIVLGANAILNAGTPEQKQALLPQIASGEVRATLAFTEPSGDWTLEGITLEADDGKLSGTKTYVIDGGTADLIVVAAREADGISFFTVLGEATKRTPLETLDMTRKQAELTFDRTDAERLGEPGAGAEALRKTLEQAAVCLASECVGGSEKTMDIGSKPSSTNAPICFCDSSPPSRRRTTPHGRRRRTTKSSASPRASRRRTAPSRTSRTHARTFRSTAGSASPTSTTRTSTTAARRRVSCSSVTRPITAN
jgi:alkylation response protein AidB-like acyl-CoA dehydrogenase